MISILPVQFTAKGEDLLFLRAAPFKPLPTKDRNTYKTSHLHQDFSQSFERF